LSSVKSSFTTRFVNHRYADFTTYIREVLLLNLESFKFRIRTTGLAVDIYILMIRKISCKTSLLKKAKKRTWLKKNQKSKSS
jgi:hypothetical protein